MAEYKLSYTASDINVRLGEIDNVVKHTQQDLTEEQQAQVRENIGALKSDDLPTKVSAFANDAGYLTSYTETDPTVPAWAKASTKPSYTASEVGLGNVDNVKQYSTSNPPPYPVTSVNGKTGAVTLDATAVGARPSSWTPTAANVGAVPTSRKVNGKALSADISLTASDVGALPTTTAIPVIDTTLSVSGKAADAKSVGDKIALLTDAIESINIERDSIIEEIITILGTPVFGTVDADNNIILTGALADGTYTIKYEDAEGNQTEIGTLEQGASYKNLADPTSADWLTDKRLNSSAELKDKAGSYVTNYIQVKAGDVVRIRGLDIRYYYQTNNATTHFYNENKGRVGSFTPATVSHDLFIKDSDGNGSMFNMDAIASKITIASGAISDIRYVRFSGMLFSGFTVNDVVITVNEEITD